jgi:hypothetical protein
MNINRASAAFTEYSDKRALVSVAEHLNDIFQPDSYYSAFEPLLWLKHVEKQFRHCFVREWFN